MGLPQPASAPLGTPLPAVNRPARLLEAVRPLVAALLLAHVLAILVMAASPRVHHWAHPDADDDDHDCAVELFLHGGSPAAPGPATVPGFIALVAAVFVVTSRPALVVPSTLAASHVFANAPPTVG